MSRIAELVAAAPRAEYQGSAFRHIAERWGQPLSGEGARIHGGRYNPPDSFPVLYLCTTRPCVVAELRHAGSRTAIDVAGLLPRILYVYEVDFDAVLDLTSPATRDALSVTTDQITATDVSLTREIGETARALGRQAVHAPSATGVDTVLAVFPESVGTGRLSYRQIERWTSVANLEGPAVDPPVSPS